MGCVSAIGYPFMSLVFRLMPVPHTDTHQWFLYWNVSNWCRTNILCNIRNLSIGFPDKKTLNTQKIVIGSRVPREKSHFHRKTNAPKIIFMVLKMLGNVERSPALYWKIIFMYLIILSIVESKLKIVHLVLHFL